MSSENVLKKKDRIRTVTTGFLPQTVLVPLCQEKDILCESLVKSGDRVCEGQVIAENSEAGADCAKIHSPIPGIVKGIRQCSFPNGKCGEAIEIALSGEFTYIGKPQKTFDWHSWGRTSVLTQLSAHGVINTFSIRQPYSLAENIRKAQSSVETRIFIRMFDADVSCQTDSVLANCRFEQIVQAADILAEIVCPKEIIFVYSKQEKNIIEKFSAAKTISEMDPHNNPESFFPSNDSRIQFVPVNQKKAPCGTKQAIAARYKKVTRSSVPERVLCENSLFVDCQTLVSFYEAVKLDLPSTRVNVNVSGDCLKSSAVLNVCVGTSFSNLARALGLEEKNIGKIIVNGCLNGFNVPSMETPVTKYVKSVSFLSKRDRFDYSISYCTGCGQCRSCCPANIFPDIIFVNLVNSVKVPGDFIRLATLCTECGLCNSVCPVKLPLFQTVKILKEKQNG